MKNFQTTMQEYAKYTVFPLNSAKNLRNIFLFKLNLLSLQCD